MLLDWCKILQTHLHYLNKKCNNNHLFLVGGCVRDILLGTNFNPHDIDVTGAGEPQDIAAAIDQTEISFFQTEKFGTNDDNPCQGHRYTTKKRGTNTVWDNPFSYWDNI